MRGVPREAAQYAILLIVLFSIAALAVSHTLSYVQERIQGTDYLVVASLFCFITYGFMLIAGAFGLLAVQFTAHEETRRRIGRLVDAMDYIEDGILSVDDKGRITGSNPAAARLADTDISPRQPLAEAFTCLEAEDARGLIATTEAMEIERAVTYEGGRRLLRFRSQPAEGVLLLLVSDVTALEARHLHSRQIAQLQLIGEIARGVAFDFNALLCSIAGHASLLARLDPTSADAKQSVAAINRGADRGVTLAAHLIDLAIPSKNARASADVGCIERAAEGLRDSLPSEWTVVTDVNDLPPVGLPGIKVEQILLNLGLLVADDADGPRTLRIRAGRSEKGKALVDLGEEYAAVVVIAATGPEAAITPTRGDRAEQAGVIESVIASMLDEAGGRLDCLAATDASLVFRIALPGAVMLDATGSMHAASDADLAPYFADWSVLFVARPGTSLETEAYLRGISATTIRVDDIVSALARLEDGSIFQAVVLDEALLESQAEGLLKAIAKLTPAALVVLTTAPDDLPGTLARRATVVPADVTAQALMLALIEAKGLAGRQREPAVS